LATFGIPEVTVLTSGGVVLKHRGKVVVDRGLDVVEGDGRRRPLLHLVDAALR